MSKDVLDIEIKFKGVDEKHYRDLLRGLQDLVHDFNILEMEEGIAEAYEVDSE